MGCDVEGLTKIRSKNCALKNAELVNYRPSGYRRSVMLANCPPVSHGSCLFHGIAELPRSSGSLTRRASCCVAHETMLTASAHSRTGTTIFRSLWICATIYHTVPRL